MYQLLLKLVNLKQKEINNSGHLVKWLLKNQSPLQLKKEWPP